MLLRKASKRTQGTVLVVSVPFSGHSNILIDYARILQKSRDVEYITLDWKDCAPPKVPNDVPHVYIQATEAINDSDPIAFNIQRAETTYPQLKSYVQKHYLERYRPISCMVYDFFTIEAAFLARDFRIPSTCSVPAMPYPSQTYRSAVRDLRARLLKYESQDSSICRRLNDMSNELTPLSDAMAVPGDSHIIWVSPTFIGSSVPGFKNPMKLSLPYPSRRSRTSSHDTIYISFGTIVSDNLLLQRPDLRPNLLQLYVAIVERLLSTTSYKIIIAAAKISQEVKKTLSHLLNKSTTSRLLVLDRVDQRKILASPSVKLFITHGGANSLNEAIFYGCPVLVFPFFGDQHVVAATVIERGIGNAAVLKSNWVPPSTHLTTISHARQQDLLQKLDQALVPSTLAKYKSRINALHSADLHKTQSIHTSLPLHSIPWQEGDLLFGAAEDRIAYVALQKIDEFGMFQFDKSFSMIFPGRPTKLPRILDLYNDVLRRPDWIEAESRRKTKFAHVLKLLHRASDPQNLIADGDTEITRGIKLRKMCLDGLRFFLLDFPSKLAFKPVIHFVLKYFDPIKGAGRITATELEWLQRHWSDTRVNQQVIFWTWNAQGEMRRIAPPWVEKWIPEKQPK